MKHSRGLSVLLVVLAACTRSQPAPPVAQDVPEMPAAISNNAVAIVKDADGFRLYSFMGLNAGKTWRDTSRQAFEYDSRTGLWSELPPVPVESGRLASIAAAVAG